MQKNVGMNFWGESFHYLAQRAQRTQRHLSLSTSNFTSHFRLHASDFVQRHSMQGAGTRSVESPCVPTNECHLVCYLSRTEDAEGAEAFVTFYFRRHASYFIVVCHTIYANLYEMQRISRRDAETRRTQRTGRMPDSCPAAACCVWTGRMPDSCTAAACCVSISSRLRLGGEAIVTSYFTLHFRLQASYFIGSPSALLSWSPRDCSRTCHCLGSGCGAGIR
jgi:hypothetical protein